ncbi:MAG: cytochrome ubiquinol oxidase subunit I [Deltaproteobacteria bacterium]|nr:cytochrome ubiquinol oxidase subunit I [Deltaproteobacteria bacterium]
MPNLLAARTLMALSLGFHIVFAAIGMAMPVLMVLAEARWRRHRDPIDKLLAQRWAKGTAILFAIGAVSGTALSFELGLLWPTFMRHAGPLVGMPFSLEGFAFFLEAIFLGLYLYGRDRLGPRAHLFACAMVAVCGMASGALVIAANAWMNTPQGFDARIGGVLHSIQSPEDWPVGARLAAAEVVEIRPWQAMFNPAFLTQAGHMLVAALAAVALAVAGVHAAMLRRDPENGFHRRALQLTLPLALAGAVAMPVTGDLAAKHLAKHQPLKLAAMEAHFHTERGAGLLVGGLPDAETRATTGALHLPKLLSILAFADPDAEVRGLDAFDRDQWPPLAVTHLAFDLMVGCGMAMLLVTALGWWLARRETLWRRPGLLRVLAWSAPLGFVAIEAGWTVTEVGRQPWIIRGMMRTAEAVTPMPHRGVPLLAFVVLYAVLGAVCAALLRYHVFHSPTTAQLAAGEADHA